MGFIFHKYRRMFIFTLKTDKSFKHVDDINRHWNYISKNSCSWFECFKESTSLLQSPSSKKLSSVSLDQQPPPSSQSQSG